MQEEIHYLNKLSVTIWGTEFFKSIQGIEVKFGERLEKVVSYDSIMTENRKILIDGISAVTYVCITIIVIAGFVLMALGQSSLSVWIALVSLQIISHIVLFQLVLPSEIFLILKNMLRIFRFILFQEQNENDDGITPREHSLQSVFEKAGYSTVDWT